MSKTRKLVDVYQMITDMIIEQLEKGTVPWARPWNGPGGFPKNLISGRGYRGINLFVLGHFASVYGSPYFLTFNQAKRLGGNVKKGSKGIPVVYWKFLIYKDKNGDDDADGKTIPMLKHFTVFNLNQVENMPEKYLPKEEEESTIVFNPIAVAEDFVNGWTDCPEIRHGGNRAYYSAANYVQMPDQESFKASERYYSTLFHELVHATGHSDHLGRHAMQASHQFGSKDYSFEELVAEMGSGYVAGLLGIDNDIEQSASYINGWLKTFKADKKVLMKAATQSQKAVEYMVDHQKNPELFKELFNMDIEEMEEVK